MTAAAEGEAARPSAVGASESLEALLPVLGCRAFRPGQRDIVEAVLAGRDVLAVLPTGAGKSLCYQLPALALPPLTLVVSPLIALMRDQVQTLRARGVAATCLHSGLEAEEQEARLAAVEAGRVQLLYVAPERLASETFLARLAPLRVSLLAVDEAHCISEWGHDFRPSYLKLGVLRTRLRAGRCVALTATATPEVRRDIASVLALRDPLVRVAGFFRPNLAVAVRDLSRVHPVDRLDRLARVVAQVPGPLLLYTATRRAAEHAASFLAERGEAAGCYHAGLEPGERERVQDAFMQGRLRVVAATNAFGMGVDKADVRAVIHCHLPGSLEAYYQEIGRGGRDGGPCLCLLLFDEQDVELRRSLVERAHPHPATARTLVEAARLGHLDAFDLEALPGCTPGRRHELRQALEGLETAAILRVGEFGRVELLEPGPDLEGLARQGKRQLRLLRRVAWFARMRRGCRHAAVLRYFGEPVSWKSCGACDLCRDKQGQAAELRSSE